MNAKTRYVLSTVRARWSRTWIVRAFNRRFCSHYFVPGVIRNPGTDRADPVAICDKCGAVFPMSAHHHEMNKPGTMIRALSMVGAFAIGWAVAGVVLKALGIDSESWKTAWPEK